MKDPSSMQLKFHLPAIYLPALRFRILVVIAIIFLAVFANRGHSADSDLAGQSRLTIDRIYKDKEFSSKTYAARWLDGRNEFTTLAPSGKSKDRRDILRHVAATGETEVMVASGDLIPKGAEKPLAIDDYAWSKDRALLLIYTNSKRVWRRNTRGDYWLLDRKTKRLTMLGGDAKPSTMMFAKLSPTGRQVAYVRDRNIYLEDLSDHSIRRLTESHSDDVINGTADWAYEEEFQVRDGFRWSPDGKRIAYWQIDTAGVGKFPLVNNTDSVYPKVTWFAYPKVGKLNPSCRIGVVDCETRKTRWIKAPGNPREHYIPRMQWAANSDELLIQQLNRLQNRNQLFLASASHGDALPLLTESDDAWVDVHRELFWLADGTKFTWISERDGWRHVYLVSRDGKETRLLTPGKFDVIRLLHVNEEAELIYFIASPDNPTERFLYRAGLNGGGVQRVTPATEKGVHAYRFSSDASFAIHVASSADRPAKTQLVRMPQHNRLRMLEGNQKVNEKLAQLSRTPTEFFRVDVGGGVQLDGWCIKPPNFDPAGSYPLLVYVYGEPAGSTVVNRWGGTTYMWHQMLAQRGYVVMSFDNRGTNAPRGREWRKSVYEKIGVLSPTEQAAAVRGVLAKRPYLDPRRVGIWGWSGGGSSSLQAIFKHGNLYSTAIAIAAVPDQRYYDTMYQERYMGLPKPNAKGYREGSPINFARHLKGNLLIVHGGGDDNCHYQTVELLIDELVAHNKQFSLMAYPNRTHSISERANTTRHLRELMTRYLSQHLPVTKRDERSLKRGEEGS